MDFGVVPIFEDNEINVCRACLSKDVETLHIFQPREGDCMNVHEIIMKICSVEIKPNDGLSQRICLKCITDAKDALSFKLKCENAQNVLLNYKRCRLGEQTILSVKEESDDSSSSNSGIKSDIEIKLEEDTSSKKSSQHEMPFSKVTLKVKFEGIDTSASCSVGDNKSAIKNDLKFPLQLRKHLHIHAAGKSLSCNKCEFRCIHFSTLQNHKFVHSKELKNELKKQYTCTFCNYKSSDSSNYNRHMSIHTGDKPYSCDICPYRCSRTSYLEEHKRIHTGEKPFLCDQCHYTCATSSTLRAHKINKHQHERKFSCDVCEFRAKSKPILISHIKTHTGEKRFACDICPYRSIQLITLENHKKMVHTLERPFACEQCPYRGANLSYLKVHRQCHQPIKSFACDECEYTCHTKFKLKCHKRSHTGEKPHQCEFCNFKSSSTSSLRQHQKRTHRSTIKL